MKFRTSLDKPAKIISALILALPAALPLFKTELAWVSLFLALIFFFCFAFSPLSYELTSTGLKINRLFKPVHIPFQQIKRVELVPEPKKLSRHTVRTFGVGGLFGYFGKFWNPGLGNMTWYLKNFQNVVLLELTDGRKILLSPDDVLMAKKLEQALRQPVNT